MDGVPDIFQYSYPVLGVLIIGCLRMAIENREKIPEGQFVLLSVFGGGAVMYMILSDLSSPLLLIWGSILAIISTSTIFRTISQTKNCHPCPNKMVRCQNAPKAVSFMTYPCFDNYTQPQTNQVYELRDRQSLLNRNYNMYRGSYNPSVLAGRPDDPFNDGFQNIQDDFVDELEVGKGDLGDQADELPGIGDDGEWPPECPPECPPRCRPRDDGDGGDGQGDEDGAAEVGVGVDGGDVDEEYDWKADESNTDTAKIIQTNNDGQGPDWEKIWNVLLFINFASLWLISTMNFVYLRQMTARMLAQKEAVEPPPIPMVPLDVGTCEELTGTLNQLFGPWNKA